jgi:glycosyltransferase involved in cell wall biosynthesis
MNMSVGIIIPCYNEANRLNISSFEKCLKTYHDFQLCFVNDGSTDHTLDVLSNFQKEFENRVTVIDIKKNKGKAAAIRAGSRFLYSLKKVKYVGYLDADLSTDFEEFNELVENLKLEKRLIMVFGSRDSDNNNIKRNKLRNFFSKVISSFIKLILKLPIKDTQCGAKVFRVKYIPIMYNSKFKSKWLFDIELFLRLKIYFKNKKIMNYIKEYPLKNWVHVDDSKLGLKDSVQIPYKLAKIWFAYSF